MDPFGRPTMIRRQKKYEDENFNPNDHGWDMSLKIQSRTTEIESAGRAKEEALLQSAARLYAAQEARRDSVYQRLVLPHQRNTSSPQLLGGHKTYPNDERWSPITEEDLFSSERFIDRQSWDMEDSSSSSSPTPTLSEVRRIPVMTDRPSGEGKVVAGGYKLHTAQTQMAKLLEKWEEFQRVYRSSVQARESCEWTPAVTPMVPARTPAPNNFHSLEVMSVTPAPPETPAPPKRRAPPRDSSEVTVRSPAPPETPAPPKRRAPPRDSSEVTVRSPAPPETPAPPKRRAPPRDSSEVTVRSPAPPETPAPPKRRAPGRGRNLRPAKPVEAVAYDEEEVNCLDSPKESLSLCLEQLESDDWERKQDGLKTVQALVRHHPQVLKTRLHEAFLLLLKEVSNLRSTVACCALDAVAELHRKLGKDMDYYAHMTCRALLAKLAKKTICTFERANFALDALVEGCSPTVVVAALLSEGLSHRDVTVRISTATHLHQLAGIVGEDRLLHTKKTAESFVHAVCKMSLDASSDVRHYGQEMLQGLIHEPKFMELKDKVISTADRPFMEKLIRRMK